MAKRKVNKSQEIRDYVSSNRDASAKEVVQAMSEKGITVTAAMVANVKSKAGLTRNNRDFLTSYPEGTKRRCGNAADVAIDALIEAKRFVKKIGSPQKAVEIIRALEKLDSIAG